jgi:hypothetical protein
MIYELRTYWAAPGKAERLHERFRTLTLRLFERHQMHLVGFWTPDPIAEETGDLVYILRFSDQDALENAWSAFRADPEWQAGKAASEEGGSLTRKVASTILLPTGSSPLQ